MSTIYSADELRDMTQKMFPCVVPWIPDATYAETTERSLLVMTRYAHRLAKRAGVTQWQTYFDCNKWAFLVRTVSRLMHAKQRYLGKAPQTEAVTVGVLGYQPDAGLPHAFNLSVLNGEIVGWEPQPGVFGCRIRTFSSAERHQFWPSCVW